MFISKKELENRENRIIKNVVEKVDEYLEQVVTEEQKKALKRIHDLEEKLKKYDEMFEDYESLSIEKTLAKRSGEPWAGLSVSEIDSNNGRVGVKLDWNEQFIAYLRRNGIQGQTDEDTMGIWFASLIKEMGTEISEEEAEALRKTHKLY